MTDVRIAFRADPSEALQASKLVEDSLNGIQKSTTATAQQMLNIVPTGLKQGTQSMQQFNRSMQLASYGAASLGTAGGQLNAVLGVIQVVMRAVAASTLSTTAAIADQSKAAYGAAQAIQLHGASAEKAASSFSKYKKAITAGDWAIGDKLASEIEEMTNGLAVGNDVVSRFTRNTKNLSKAEKELWANTFKLRIEQDFLEKSSVNYIAASKAANNAVIAQTAAMKAAGVAATVTANQFALLAAKAKALALALGPIGWMIIAYMTLTSVVNKYSQSVLDSLKAEEEAAKNRSEIQTKIIKNRERQIEEVKDMEVELAELTLSEEKAAKIRLQRDLEKRIEIIRDAASDELNLTMSLNRNKKLSEEQKASLKKSIYSRAHAEELIALQIHNEKLKQFDKERAQEVKDIYQEILNTMETYGMDEADLVERRLRALGAEESTIKNLVNAYKEYLGLTKEQVNEEEKKVDLLHKAQMIDAAQMFSRIQTAAMSDIKKEEKKDRAAEEAKRQTEIQQAIKIILERIERHPAGLN